MKIKTQWRSPRLHQDVQLVRWGEIGQPVLLFPTAGGDAEEMERFHMIDAVGHLLEAGRIKVYSCDSVGGRVMAAQEGSPEHRMWVKNQFQQYVYHEVVPAIGADCHDLGIELIAAGASIGAFNALAMVCRYPDAFKLAICLSGSYDMERFIKGRSNDDLYFASPLHYVPQLDGEHLARLRERFVLLASGEGSYEDIGESWRVADVLGRKGIPNRVDPWGRDFAHDWITWRRMLPQYLDEFTTPS